MNIYYTVSFLVYLETICVLTSNHADADSGNTYSVLETGHNESQTDILVSVNELKALDVYHDTVSNIANHDHTFMDDVSGSINQQQAENSVDLNNVTFVSQPAEDRWTDDNITANDIIYNNIRLPQSIRPRLYNITLQPFVDSDDPDDFYFFCEVIIHIECMESTEKIFLHSVDHDIKYISIENRTEKVEVTEWWQNEGLQMLLLKTSFMLMAGEKYILTIRSTSRISGSLRGFYYSPYNEGNQTKFHGGGRPQVPLRALFQSRAGTWVEPPTFRKLARKLRHMKESDPDRARSYRAMCETCKRKVNGNRYIFTTIMEPTDARRVFPNFDEPDFKAVFIFNIKRKEGQTSVTNLPKRITLGPDEDGFYTDIFDEPKSVPMSSYLVAVAIGDLEYMESTINNITFRTWCRSGEVNKTKYALEIGMKFMEFFEDYFQIPYPLPKEDMIAVPTMSFSGMEHWGLITYRESIMFYEEGISSMDEKELMTVIIAHEVAHQWFGNLVSPYWWDDLWLNEGFATYMMFFAVDRVLPSWDMANKLIVDTRGIHNVMKADDNVNTHPVYVSVYNPDDIKNIFDLISYAKGSAVIRMMNFFLGDDTFRKGLTRYLKDFSYRTATHNDLWTSLSQQAEIDNHTHTDVKEVMDTWVLVENYPVVSLKRINNTTVELSQSAFLQTEDQRLDRAHIQWKIPFVYTTDIDRNFHKTFTDITWITNKTAHVTDANFSNASWIIGNIQQYGFFRVNYEDSNWNALLDQLLSNHTVIHPINRAQIINDAWNLARAGLLDMEIAIRTLDYLDNEVDFVPWKAALQELKYVKTSLQLTSLYGLFESFMRKTLEKAFFSAADAGEHYDRLKYSMIANAACEFGLKACTNEAVEMFTAWKLDGNIRVDPDIKETIYCTGVRNGERDDWAFVLKRFILSQSTSEKNALIGALTCTEVPWLLRTLTDMVFDGRVFSRTEKVSVMVKLSKNPIGRLMAWNILEENWDKVSHEFGKDMDLLTGIFSAITEPYNSVSELNRVKAFLTQQKDLGAAKKMLEIVLDHIQSNIEWLNKYRDTIKSWLTNGEIDI